LETTKGNFGGDEMNGITVHKDEHGVTREYLDVKRKANAGELIKIVNASSKYENYKDGDVLKVDRRGNYGVYVESAERNGNAEGLVYNYEYVVLERTDIIHCEGKRYRELNRKVRPFDIVMDKNNKRLFYIHEVTPYRVFGFLLNSRHDMRAELSHSSCIVLEPVDDAKPTVTISTDDERIAELERRVAELEERISGLEYYTGAVQTQLSQAYAEEKHKQLTRAEVIEMAKNDLLWLQDTLEYRTHGKHTMRFVENRDKRTVVALICDENGNVVSRGVAKLWHEDCFNIHIGRVVSAFRAMGEDVPGCYMDVPQPTEAQVGDVVKWVKFVSDHRTYVITRRAGCDYDFVNVATGKPILYCKYQSPLVHDGDSFVIIDDSHDFGGKEDQFGA
jgi:hypothetical protein